MSNLLQHLLGYYVLMHLCAPFLIYPLMDVIVETQQMWKNRNR